MTSNIGADMIKRQTSFGFAIERDEIFEEKASYDEMRKKLIDSLERVFRPEFINRLDSVIVFRSLSRENIKKIVSLELDKVANRLHEHEIVLHASENALGVLAEKGFDPEMGARPLRRVIQQVVEDPLSDSSSRANSRTATWSWWMSTRRIRSFYAKMKRKPSPRSRFRELTPNSLG